MKFNEKDEKDEKDEKVLKEGIEALVLLSIIVLAIWCTISFITSLFVAISVNSDNGFKDTCNVKTPWSTIFYGKLFCPIERGNK